MKDIKRVKAGRKALISGRRFEAKVRKDLENKDWIVSRWQNNVELICTKVKEIKENPNFIRGVKFIGKLIPARQGRFRKTSTGFPDFIAYRFFNEYKIGGEKGYVYQIIGIECKSNGYLTKEEKEKLKWLLENNVFSKILIASKGKKRGEIVYNEFEA